MTKIIASRTFHGIIAIKESQRKLALDVAFRQGDCHPYDQERTIMDTTQPSTEITADTLVQDLIEQYPRAIRVFSRHGLHCVGCYISPFHTIADTAREYALVLEPLLAELRQAAKCN
jgi:hybrid cluster-associated redox disulfide protein